MLLNVRKSFKYEFFDKSVTRRKMIAPMNIKKLRYPNLERILSERGSYSELFFFLIN